MALSNSISEANYLYKEKSKDEAKRNIAGYYIISMLDTHISKETKQTTIYFLIFSVKKDSDYTKHNQFLVNKQTSKILPQRLENHGFRLLPATLTTKRYRTSFLSSRSIASFT